MTGAQAEPLRIGILGAARIAELSIVKPAQATGSRLVAIAARDVARAGDFAEQHGVERVVAGYQELVDDPEIDVVYNPLPNGLHGRWNLAAVRAGKHVLSEKPFAANAEEARMVRDAAAGTSLVVAEAFHYLYHPITHRLHEILANGELGNLLGVEIRMLMPDPGRDDPRWKLALAGGATMDLGCYALHAQRALAPWAGGEPVLLSAKASERAGHPGVDEWLQAELAFPGGAWGTARCDMNADHWEMTCRVIGTQGQATVGNFVQPHLDDRITVETAQGRRIERLGTRSSYTYQLEVFADAVRHGIPFPTDADDAVITMALIDQCYRAAGLDPRPISA
jgi:predicted dehydrogenase